MKRMVVASKPGGLHAYGRYIALLGRRRPQRQRVSGVLLAQLALATLMVMATIIIHLTGLALLMALMRLHTRRWMTTVLSLDQGAIVLGVAFGLFALHTTEIWLYAGVYLQLHAVEGLERALYFSTSTYATVGYGDSLVSAEWRIFGAIEGINGMILLGWSTAFFISVLQRLRALEHDWLAPRPQQSA